MRRGFILTLLTLVLFMILVQMAVQLRTERSRVSSWTQSMMVDRKMLYTTDDIAEEAKYMYGVRLERTGTRLAFYDTMPANYSIDRSLRGYRDFLLQKYLTADMSLQFYDTNRTAMDLTALDPSLITYPYNLTYRYGNINKTVLSVYCAPAGSCNGSYIESAELNYKFWGANFTWMPTAGNISHYNWNPRSLGNCTGDPKCINFTLKLTDALGYTFACPSSMCNYSTFLSNSASVLDVEMSPCWLEIRLGDNNIVKVNSHQPGDASLPCRTPIDVNTTLNLSTDQYYIDMPGVIEATDVNYNFLRRLQLPGENVSARNLLLELPSSYHNVESSCFSANPNTWAGGSSNRYVYGLRVANTCPGQRITITNMTVSWTPVTTQRIEIININGTDVWNYNTGIGTPQGRQPSGTKLNILDYTLDPGVTKNVSYFRFNASMVGKTFNITFTFGDNSTAWTPANT